jgi:hypothetical protein
MQIHQPKSPLPNPTSAKLNTKPTTHPPKNLLDLNNFDIEIYHHHHNFLSSKTMKKPIP